MPSSTMEDKRFTKHGFPKGFRFVPTHVELLTILSLRIQGRRLHPKVDAIFHDLNILNYHPAELHEKFERDKEHRYIYFFSQRQFQRSAAAGAAGADRKRQRGAGGHDEDDNEPRPVRMAKGGGWKPSGGGHVLRWPNDKGGFVAGKMVTMVFYDHRDGGEQVKSQWGMHEFTVPIDPRQLLSKPTKTRVPMHDLALYRLYKLKSDDMDSDDGAGSNHTLANVGHFSAPPCPAGQPSFGIFTGRNQPLAGGASTSRMPPPPQLQQHIPNVGRPQYYYHDQYAFGTGPASAAHHQRVHTMTMAPAYGTGMHGGGQLFPFARPAGTGLPAHQSLQFARPPTPSQMPVPPAAANKASHQAPAKATYGGAGQGASHSGATRSLPSASVSTPPPAAAESPSAEELLAPMTATHGVAGQEAGGDSGATRSSPATGSRPAEQDATATTEPRHNVQFADCVKPEGLPPPIEDRITADNNDGIEMPAYDLDIGMFELEDYRFQCTMDELFQTSDEPTPTQGDNN